MTEQTPEPSTSSKDQTHPDSLREKLSPAAQRALAEAKERRAIYVENESRLPKEIGGRRQGLEPGRYGDWEVKGLTSDF